MTLSVRGLRLLLQESAYHAMIGERNLSPRSPTGRMAKPRQTTSQQIVPLRPGPPEESASELAPGYYACTVGDKTFAVGEVVYLLEDLAGRVSLVRGDRQWRMDAADFARCFAFDPEGLAHRTAEMARLMSEIAELQATGMRSQDLLRSFNPHLDATGDVSGMALVPTASSPLAAKRSIAEIRNQAALLHTDLEIRQTQIKAFAEEQAIILRAQSSALQAVLKVAEEAVWTINLYLGQNEEIVRLTEGVPASAETPITIRQLVLYMDEECAVAAEEGGLDARNIEEFDAWLTADPAHLAQVLPEPKGMVALKPRRQRRDYGDAWMQAAMDEANRKTYFLLRNGDNLYRMWTSYEVNEHLVPRTDEFLAFFLERRYNRETGRNEKVQLQPGSAEFMKAEKAAESHKRHYMRAALILQGLLDRTTVFHPLSGKFSVADQASYVPGGPLQVILDGDLLLSDGRERFAAWFARINGELAVGMRIVGAFGSWEHGLHQYDREKSYQRNERVSPHGAGYPNSNQLYTLEEKRGDGFVFYFARSNERWDNDDGFVAYQKRASCLVQSHDQFILNFDAASVEEMRFYLSSRLDRTEYTYLFPTLKLAISLKEAEASAEAPFALLLAGQIVTAHGPDAETASALVPELIRWWKFKNRTHRALTSEDAKALRMIVAEYGQRLAQEEVREQRSAEAEQVLSAVLAAEPNALLVAHKAGVEYAVLLPANEENVFVHEEVWTVRGRRERRPWRVVDKRFQRWQILHAGERWAHWKTGAVRSEQLSDPERRALVEEGFRRLQSSQTWRDLPAEPRDTEPLAATVRPDGTLELYYRDERHPLPTEHLLTSRLERPDLGRATIAWKRHAARTPVIERLRESSLTYESGMPWESTYDHRPYAGKVLFRVAPAIASFRAEVLAYQKVLQARQALEAKLAAAFAAYERSYLLQLEAEAQAKFAADYGDPALWEGHRKTLRLPQQLPDHELRGALAVLIERHLSLSGLTAGAVVDQAALLSGKTFQLDEGRRDLRADRPEKVPSA